MRQERKMHQNRIKKIKWKVKIKASEKKYKKYKKTIFRDIKELNSKRFYIHIKCCKQIMMINEE